MNILLKKFTASVFLIPVIASIITLNVSEVLNWGIFYKFLLMICIVNILNKIYSRITIRKQETVIEKIFSEYSVEKHITKNRILGLLGIVSILALTYFILTYTNEKSDLTIVLGMIALVSWLYYDGYSHFKLIGTDIEENKKSVYTLAMIICSYSIIATLKQSFAMLMLPMIAISILLPVIILSLYKDVTRPMIIPKEG